MNEQCNDDDILRGLCQGQGRAYLNAVACLHQNCKPCIVKWLTRHGIPSDEAETFWYESITDAWKNLCLDGKPLTTGFCGYLFGIAFNKWKTHWRERGRQEPDVPPPTPDEFENNKPGIDTVVKKWFKPRKSDLSDQKIHRIPAPAEPENPMPEDILQQCRSQLSAQARNLLDDALAGWSNEDLAEKYEYSVNVLKQTKSRHLIALGRCIRGKTAERNCFGKLDPKCQALIRDHRRKFSWEAIAKKHGFEDVASARSAHDDCLKKLAACVEAELSKFK